LFAGLTRGQVRVDVAIKEESEKIRAVVYRINISIQKLKIEKAGK